MEILMEKILIIQTAFPGDAILTLPLIQKTKYLIPVSQIEVIATPETKGIFETSPFVKKVIVLDKKGEHKSLFSLIKFGMSFRNYYDQVISPHRSFRSSLLVYLANAKKSVGFDTASFNRVYKKLIPYDKTAHEVKRNLSLIKFGIEDWKIKPLMKLEEKSEKLLNLIKRTQNEKFIVIAPGSVWKTKKYPEEHFYKIADYFAKKGFTIVFTGGASEVDLCRRMAENTGHNSFSLAGKLSIPESVELFKNCKLVISNDSAPTHMAVAANTFVITIYCSTVPEFGFYPYSEKSRFISDNSLSCKPCGIHGRKSCPEKHFGCGNNLKPETIINEIETLNL